jgi:hypothetical protein
MSFEGRIRFPKSPFPPLPSKEEGRFSHFMDGVKEGKGMRSDLGFQDVLFLKLD